MARFIVEYTFHGRSSRIVHADSKEEVEAKIDSEVNSDSFEIDTDEVDDVDYTVREMHPITRDGREVWSTLVLPTDTRGHASALKSAPLFAEGG